MNIRRSVLVVAAACAALGFTAALHASEIAIVTPDQVGLSSERLTRLDRAMQAEIDAGRKAGIITLIARNGHIAHLKSYGKADLASNRPMRTDSVVRLYSMTKPITSVALLMLFEEGKFRLSDPLEQYLPAFQNVKVMKSTADSSGPMQLEDPKRKITIHDVFRHTAGFVYGFGPTPVDKAYQQAGLDVGKVASLDDLVKKVATQPLLYHPGERWVYSVAHDVQASLVEKLSGMRFDQFVRTRILEPLGMKDTGFGVPPAMVSRYTACYGAPENGRLKEMEKADGTAPDGGYARYTKAPFGGHGLSSTITDYLRFAQMLLNGGELDGVRILGRKTVELMTSDNLPPGVEDIFPGIRYGLGVSYLKSSAESGNLGSRGQFGWGGAASTWVSIDPRENMISIVFTQYMPYDNSFLSSFQTLAYQTLVDSPPTARPSP